MRTRTMLLAAAVASLIVFQAAAASAEAPVFVEKDKLYTYLNMGFYFPTKSYYNGTSDVKRDLYKREYAEQFYDLGVVFGFKDSFDFLFNLPLHHYSLKAPEGNVNDPSGSLGDRGWTRLDYVGLGFRWKVPCPWHESALTAQIQIPTGAQVDPEPHYYGDGRLAAVLDYTARKDFMKMWFAQGHLGLQFIDEKPQNRVVYGFGGGAKIHKYANVGLNFEGAQAFTADANDNPFQDLPKEQGWLWLKPFIYANPIDKLEVRLAYDYLVTGMNAFLQNGIELGVAYTWF